MEAKTKFSKDLLKDVKGFIEQKVEYCGNLILKDNIIHLDKKRFEGQVINNRNACIVHNKGDIIWHTHIKSGKYYPSYEDIRTVLKQPTIKYSFIFTIFGCWIIKYSGQYEKYNSQKLKTFIDAVNARFYRKTNKGRKYIEEEIEYYIETLNKNIVELRTKENKFNIKFKKINYNF